MIEKARIALLLDKKTRDARSTGPSERSSAPPTQSVYPRDSPNGALKRMHAAFRTAKHVNLLLSEARLLQQVSVPVHDVGTCQLPGQFQVYTVDWIPMGSLPQPEPNERPGAILAICQKMNSERDLGPLLDVIAREATSLLDCDRASIFLLDRERNELWSKVALGSDEILRFDARRGIAGQAALTGNVINVKDAYSDPRFYTAIDGRTGYRTRNVLAVPVRNQHNAIVGSFEVLNKRIGVFSARDEESLLALASHAANAIETAQLIGELRRNHDQLEQQNAHLLREVESRYSTHGIIGTGQKIQQVVRLIERIRDSLVSVLVTGESGTGKELVA